MAVDLSHAGDQLAGIKVALDPEGAPLRPHLLFGQGSSNTELGGEVLVVGKRAVNKDEEAGLRQIQRNEGKAPVKMLHLPEDALIQGLAVLQGVILVMYHA